MSLRNTGLPPDWPTRVFPLVRDSLPREAFTVEKFLRLVILDPNFRPQHALCVWDGDELVGYCQMFTRIVPLENAPPDQDRAYITLFCIKEGRRRQGIGKRLLDDVERICMAEGKKSIWVSPYSPGYVLPGVDVEANPETLAFLLSQGYEEVYRPIAMQADLWDLRVPEWVVQKRNELGEKRVRFGPFQPELAWPILEFARDEFAGDWVRWAKDAMVAITAGDRPDRLVSAWVEHKDGRLEVLGFSHYGMERFGPIGVSSKHRGKGIGQVLMYDTLQAQREAGYRVSWFLWSDDKTAERLYSEAGFREIRRFAMLKKVLLP